jgi:hypothetical protein
VDIEIPRVETRGTESFYAGVTTMRDGSVHQWMIETRPQAARRIGDGHAWAEADHSSVSATVVARVESDWSFLALRCPIPH